MLSLLAAISLMLPAMAQSDLSPKRELRSTWLTTVWAIDWPSSKNESSAKQQMTKYLDALHKHNFTGVCFQVRGMADAMYKSSYEPWCSQLTGTRGKDPGWDPLAYVVEECHKRGMECYAWVNPYRESSSSTIQNSDFDRQWESDGLLLSNGKYIVFNPGLAEARAHILKVIKEIYTNYAIDGMLFDDYFYPSGGMSEDSSAADYELYKSSGTTLSIGDWRRQNVNDFMKEIYDAIQVDRPDMRFGLSPAGVAGKSASKYGVDACPVKASDWQYDQIYSDPLAWLNEGAVDFISPQLYWLTTHSTAPFEPLTKWWTYVADHFGRHFYSSHSISLLVDNNTEANWEDLAKQVTLHRKYHTVSSPGNIFYSAKNIDGIGSGGVSGLGDYLQENVYQNPSLVPTIGWKEHAVYEAPGSLSLSENKLRWDAVEPATSNAILRYSVYAVPSTEPLEYAMDSNGDGIDGQYLLGVSYTNSYTLDDKYLDGYYYAVCVYDGYGFESEPAILGDTTGSEYVPVTDPATYNSGDYTLTSLWMRSTKEGFDNFAVEDNGTYNRGMAATADYVYISGRNANASDADLYLRVYDAVNGRYIRDLALSASGKSSYYPCNDVIKDSKGNICITNLTLNVSSTPLRINLVNLEDGSLTEVASLTASTGRIDHAGIFGDVTTGNFTVFAAVASNKILYRWTVANGKASAAEQVTISEFYPSSADGFSIAPRVYPISDSQCYIDGHSTAAALYDFATGKIVDAPTDATAPTAVSANGIVTFDFNGDHFAVYSASGTEPGHTHHIAMSKSEKVLSTGSVLWTVPRDNLGSINSTTCSAPADAVALDDQVRIYTYSPGNGVAAYKLISTDPSSVADAVISQRLRTIGRTVVFGSAQQFIKVFNATGLMVATAANASTVTLPAQGVYIVVTPDSAAKVIVK